MATLLERAQRGDPVSLQLLCKKLENYIKGYFLKKFQNSFVADDLSQEAYMRLLKDLMQIRDHMKFKSFVARVLFHVSQDYLRQKYRLRSHVLSVSYATGGIHYVDSNAEIQHKANDVPNDVMILSKVDLEKALARLPEKSRDILMMRSAGYNYEEISAETGLTVSGVKMQVKRSMELVRDALSM